MITGELKNKIDAIWQDFYNENMAQNSEVVNQLTTLMFIKMLDDRQRSVEARASMIGENPNPKELIFKKGNYINKDSDFTIPYDDLRWNNFKNLNSLDLANRIKNYVFPFIKDLGKSVQKNNDESEMNELTAFSKFTQKNLNYGFDSKERLLTSIVDKLSDPEIDFSNIDIMGDFYEYLINGKITGQFRTPRHIIALANELIKPRLGEKIIDPACGSSGFLIGAAHYIKSNQERDLINVANKKTFSNDSFWGVDNDMMMARISSMNLMLHGIKKPHISTDSLLESENAKDFLNKFDVVMANPPFSGSLVKTAINGSLLAISDTSQTELLFVALFLKILKVGGRCISVVPDGVLANNNEKAYRNLRQELVDKQRLIAVISLPSGVFYPYTPQKTSLILFQKTNGGGTKTVWFYDMKADGYSLNSKRKPIKDNDIPEIIRTYGLIKNSSSFANTNKSFLVNVEEIRKNSYDLSINKYRKLDVKKIEHRFTKTIFDDLRKNQNSINSMIKDLEKLL